jgi:hypothetical protein
MRRPEFDIEMNEADIDLLIDQIVVDGSVASDAESIRAVVELELSRAITDRGLTWATSASTDLEQIHGGDFELAPSAGESRAGARIGQAIYQGLER